MLEFYVKSRTPKLRIRIRKSDQHGCSENDSHQFILVPLVTKLSRARGSILKYLQIHFLARYVGGIIGKPGVYWRRRQHETN